MIQRTVNPYLSTIFTDGLDYVGTHLPGSPSVATLVSTVLTYIQSLGWFGSTPGSLPLEISSVAYSAINSYTNGQVWSMYSGVQKKFVNDLIGTPFFDKNTVDTAKDDILDIEDNIPRKGLNVREQTPLFLATLVGQTGYDYWLYQINNAVSSPWTTYLSPAMPSPMDNLIYYTTAGETGALIGARTPLMIAPTTEVVSNEIICSMTAAITVAAGYVVYGWIPRVVFPIQNDLSKVITEDISKDSDLINVLTIIDEINYRASAHGFDRNQLLDLLRNNDLNNIASLLNYMPEELISKANSINLSIINLRNRFPFLNDPTSKITKRFVYQSPKNIPYLEEPAPPKECSRCWVEYGLSLALCAELGGLGPFGVPAFIICCKLATDALHDCLPGCVSSVIPSNETVNQL